MAILKFLWEKLKQVGEFLGEMPVHSQLEGWSTLPVDAWSRSAGPYRRGQLEGEENTVPRNLLVSENSSVADCKNCHRDALEIYHNAKE